MTDTQIITDQPCMFNCGATVVAARIEIGYLHCMGRNCVAEWRRRRLDEAGYVLVFVHKMGMRWIKRDQVPDNDMKRCGGN